MSFVTLCIDIDRAHAIMDEERPPRPGDWLTIEKPQAVGEPGEGDRLSIRWHPWLPAAIWLWRCLLNWYR